MKLSKIQSEVASDTHRFKTVIAGRRSGKSYLAIREICYQAKEPNKLVWFITSSYRAAKMIIWKPLKQKLLDLNWVSKINEAELTIHLHNGSEICLKGSENAAGLRGVSLSYAVFDEAAQVDPDCFYEVVRPALADQQGGAMFITTPLGKSNWTFDLYNQPEKDPDNWKSWQFTTMEGGWVSPEEIEQAKKEMSEPQFRQEFMATFETLGNLVAYSWNRDKNIRELENPNLENLIVGADFNVSPIVACVMVREGEDMYVIDEVHMYSSNTNELADELKFRYPRSKITVMPDPSGTARKTSANGVTDHTILRNAGFQVKAPRRHDPVRDRINILNARLRTADGKNHLFVSKKCKYTIEAMEKYTFKPGTQQPDKDSGYDHMFDALSYAIAWEFGLKRDLPPMPPERWGVRVAAPYQKLY